MYTNRIKWPRVGSPSLTILIPMGRAGSLGMTNDLMPIASYTLSWTPYSAHRIEIPDKTRIDGGPEDKGPDMENARFTKEERECPMPHNTVDDARAT